MSFCLILSSCAVLDSVLNAVTGWRDKNIHQDVKFEDMVYTRPDGDALLSLIDQAISDFDSADSAQKQMEVVNSFSTELSNFSCMYTLAQIHSYLDATDEFYN